SARRVRASPSCAYVTGSIRQRPRAPRGDVRKTLSGSDRTDVRCLLSLRALDDVELHLLTFGQRSVPIHLDGGVVDEDVIAVGSGDEAEALLVAEPLDRTFCHVPSSRPRCPDVQDNPSRPLANGGSVTPG